jgi:hypothetical protein
MGLMSMLVLFGDECPLPYLRQNELKHRAENNVNSTEYFKLPVNRVLELGARVEIRPNFRIGQKQSVAHTGLSLEIFWLRRVILEFLPKMPHVDA